MYDSKDLNFYNYLTLEYNSNHQLTDSFTLPNFPG